MSTELATERIVGWVSWAVLQGAAIYYSFGRSTHYSHVAFTPFTGNWLLMAIFNEITLLSQVGFLTTGFANASPALVYHFLANIIGMLVWLPLFSAGHYFLSLIVAALVFLNATYVFIIRRSYRIQPFQSWLTTHWPVAAMPMTWGLFTIFWNGAVLFHARHLLSRLVANFLIWTFLLVPGAVSLASSDPTVALFNAWNVAAIGVAQFFTKVFALQWIFAFVIAGLLAAIAVVAGVQRFRIVDRTERSPLLAH